MSPTEINVAIAELLGWVLEIRPTPSKQHPLGRTQAWWKPDGTIAHILPDFYNDLNACAQFEATITLQEKEEYAYLLYNFTTDTLNDSEGDPHWDVICEFAIMTAPQRCESFLRMKSKWTAGTAEERKDAR